MHFFFKGLLILMLLYAMFMHGVALWELSLLLFVVILDVFRERFFQKTWLLIVEGACIAIGTYFFPGFSILFLWLIYDTVRMHFFIFGLIPLSVGLVLTQFDPELAILGLIVGFVGHMMKEKEKMVDTHTRLYDKERRLRYQLEQTKAKLMASTKEAVHMAEIKERNRIARDLHDHVGHSLAGILMQMRAGLKIAQKQPLRSEKLFQNSIDALDETLVNMRNTVHNIRPKEQRGMEYIKEIADNFTFCKVELTFKGLFENIPSEYVELIGSNMKEALTNVAKHSDADWVHIDIQINERFVRLYIKDNGSIPISVTNEGMGLSSMKERVENTGGRFSAQWDDGFVLVAILPMDKQEGGKLFENIDRR